MSKTLMPNDAIWRTSRIRDFLVLPKDVKRWTIEITPRERATITLFYPDDRKEECYMEWGNNFEIYPIPFRIIINGVVKK
jgi:hypothetical protein